MSVRDVYEPKSVNISDPTTIEGYGCICGFMIEDRRVFQNHLLLMGARDGRGVHKSLGRINLRTGEILEPPWAKRTRWVRAKQAKREFSVKGLNSINLGEIKLPRKYEEQREQFTDLAEMEAGNRLKLEKVQETLNQEMERLERLVEKQREKKTMTALSEILEMAQKIIEKELRE